MSVGFESYTDDGTVQLSANLKNPVLKTKGTASVSGGTATITYAAASGEVPLLAIAPSAAVRFTANFVSGNTWTWQFAGTDGQSIPYYVFGNPPAPTGSFGLELYDASGALTFSIQNKPLRIVDCLTGTLGVAGGQSPTYTAGREYAAIVGKRASFERYQARPDETDVFGLAVRQITDGISVSSVQYATETGDSGVGATFAPYQVLVVDVTDY